MKKILAFALALALSMRPCDASLVTKPYTFQPATTIYSAQVNSDFDTLYSLVNGNLDNTNIGAAGIFASQIIPTTSGQATFGGTQVFTFPRGLSVPPGYSISGDVPNKIYNVSTYGAKCDGSTNDTTAFQNAINAAQVGNIGGIVFIPPGTCVLSSNLTAVATSPVIIQGSGRWVTTLNANANTGNFISIPGGGGNVQWGVKDLTINHTSSRSSGYDISLGGTGVTGSDYPIIQNVETLNSASCFQFFNVNFVTVDNVLCSVAGGSTGAIGFNVATDSAVQTNVYYINNAMMYGSQTANSKGMVLPANGLLDQLMLTNSLFEQWAVGLTGGQSTNGGTYDAFVSNTLFDGTNSNSVSLIASGASGKLQRFTFDHDWFTSATTRPIVINSAGGGTVQYIHINDSYILGGPQSSVIIDGTTTTDISLRGNHIEDFGANTGIVITGGAGVGRINIENNYIGQTDGSTAGTGISFAATIGGQVNIQGNDLHTTTTPISGISNCGTSCFVANNYGSNLNTSTSASGADGWTWNRLGTASTDNLAAWQYQGAQKMGITGAGKLSVVGQVLAGSALGGLTLSAGDVGISRSTTTGSATWGGTGSSCTFDYGVTTGSVMTSSCGLAGTTGAFTGAVTSPTIAKIYAAASQLATSPHFESFTGSINNQTLTLNFGTSYAAAPICTVSVGTSGHTASINAVATGSVAINDAAADTYYVICMGQ